MGLVVYDVSVLCWWCALFGKGLVWMGLVVYDVSVFSGYVGRLVYVLGCG